MSQFKIPYIAKVPLCMRTDGDGITTLVGIYGCPLRCKWCINAYAQEVKENVKWITCEELYEQVKHHHLYYLSTGGGLTFGGAECLQYAEFICEFARTYQIGWKYNVETSLHVDWEQIRCTIPYINQYIVDIKTMNPQIYCKYTGSDNQIVIDNLKKLLCLAGNERIVVKVPLIPEYNTVEDQKKSIELLKDMGIENIYCFHYRKTQGDF